MQAGVRSLRARVRKDRLQLLRECVSDLRVRVLVIATRALEHQSTCISPPREAWRLGAPQNAKTPTVRSDGTSTAR